MLQPAVWRISIIFAPLLCVPVSAEDANFWRKQALDDITKTLSLVPNTNIARNVILFVGDGLGINTVTAARILRGQLRNLTGEETRLHLETLPYVGLAKVYSTDMQVPDSGSTATAMLTGVKTKSQLVGLDDRADYNVCDNRSENRLTTMLHWSQQAGKSTGLVTTTRVTHATPAAAYAHVANRNWENDRVTPPGCRDIAKQLVWDNSAIQVILGGGRSYFLPTSVRDPETGVVNNKAQRLDEHNLIRDWLFDKQARNRTHEFVWNKGQFDRVDPQQTEYMFGLFSEGHMAYELDRQKYALDEPSLADMTRKAIQILQKNDRGFFLLVEGGRIDHGHHENSAKKALFDTLAFDDAVNVAMRMTDAEDTLIIVTGDHSHVMTIAGYPERGNGILDTVRSSGDAMKDLNGLPYSTLAYTNGPTAAQPKQNLSDVNTNSDSYRQQSMTPLSYETHSGEDVAVYASGPMAHLLTGVKEQNVIAYVMAHAACVGDVGIACTHGRNNESRKDSTSRGNMTVISTIVLIWCLMIATFWPWT